MADQYVDQIRLVTLDVYKKLPFEDKHFITKAARRLSNQLDGVHLGERGAVEILGALGRLLANASDDDFAAVMRRMCGHQAGDVTADTKQESKDAAYSHNNV